MNVLAEAAAGSAGWIIAIVVSVLSGLVGGLVLLNLQSLKACMVNLGVRMDKQDSKVSDVERGFVTVTKEMSQCKQDCNRSMVSKEDWVREIGYSRRLQEQQIRDMAELKTLVNIIEKLPEITRQIVSGVMQETYKRDNHGQSTQ